MTKKYNAPEELYMDLAIGEFLERAHSDNISPYVQNAYEICKRHLDNISLETFAARVANYNPNKSGIGEKSQILWLKENKFPNISRLPSTGAGTLSLSQLPSGKLVVMQGKKSNIPGVKSFDAATEVNGETALFVLKTVDMGFFTDSTGGGHQTNVADEIVNFVSWARTQKLSFSGKNVKIYVVIDGRSAGPIIAAARKEAGNCPHIVVGESTSI